MGDEDQLVAKDIIRSLCSHLPEDRPSIEEVCTLVSPSALAAHERVETITAQLIRQSQTNAVKSRAMTIPTSNGVWESVSQVTARTRPTRGGFKDPSLELDFVLQKP